MAQSLAKIYVHAIFSTKNREPLIFADWRDELFRVVGGVAGNIGCQSLIVGGLADHTHILFTLGRKTSVADAIRDLKSNSSAWVNQRSPRPFPFHWQSGYAAFSVSQSNIEAVRTYIREQEKHHALQSFQDEIREWLRRYLIEWDERYVWD